MYKISKTDDFDEWINNINNTFKNGHSQNSGKIYVDAYWADYLGTFLPRFLYAKGLQNGGIGNSIVVLSENINSYMHSLCESYKIEIKDIQNKRSFLKAVIHGVAWLLFNNTEEKIYKIKYKGISIGKYIADFIIRHSDDLFSLRKFRIRELKKLVLFAWRLVEIDKIFMEAPPSVYLVLETGFWFGPVIKMAENYGASIIQCTSGNRVIPIGRRANIPINSIDSWNYEVHKGVEKIDRENIDYKSWADDYYKRRRRGLTDKDAEDAYANKLILTRKEWQTENSVDSNKKNIVIMAHCFSDDANTTTSRSIYRDYFQWLISTLEIIHKVDNVNWLLKAHPGRAVYNEGNYVYEIFAKYADKKNIYVLDDNISSESLYEIIDGAITVLGTCGLEFSSFGIPVVCAGLSSYGGFGFAIEPLTEEEYINCLLHMNEIKTLSQDKIDMARKVSYAYFNLRKPSDDFDKIFEDSLKKDNIMANDYVIENLNKLYADGHLETESFFYQKGIEEAGRGMIKI